jgi:hypothetical protein
MAKKAFEGPRLIIKADWVDGKGNPRRGCILTPGNTRPEVWAIVRSALRTAPHGLEAVTLSEGWRHIRETLDRHNTNDGIDISLRDISDDLNIRTEAGHAWAGRIADDLEHREEASYDIACHGEGWNVHIHGEQDS